MKFNIGDKVTLKPYEKVRNHVGISKGSWESDRAKGKMTVSKVSPHMGHYNIELMETSLTYDDSNFAEYDCLTVPSQKIVIISDGKATLARLYDGEKVTRSAEAKCSPADTYDFATGANLAYDRLMRPEAASVKPQDKPRFKAGDKAKVIANTCVHGAEIGSIVTLDKPYTPILRSNAPAWTIKGNDRTSYTYISERDLEPYAEPTEPAFSWDDFKAGKIAVHCDTEAKAKAFIAECNKRGLHWPFSKDGTINYWYGSDTAYRYSDDSLGYCPCSYYESEDITIVDYPLSAEPAEPVKLYCVKSNLGWLTKGKTYEFDGCTLMYDNGPSFHAKDFADYKRGDPNLSSCLIPLVSRPAKAGEWFTPIKDSEFHDGPNGELRYKKGDLLLCTQLPSSGPWSDKAVIYNNTVEIIKHGDYLVLDGYDGRYEPKEPPKSCENCKQFCIINKSPVYAYCPKKKKVFECFGNDTKKGICDDWSEGEAT